jgi:hypothetical protein
MGPRRIVPILAASLLASGTPGLRAAEDVLSLAGEWRIALDPDDEGLPGRWSQRRLGDVVVLPGAMEAQGYGDDVTVDTEWTGSIVDRSWFTAPRYAPYRRPGNVKIPFWLQPEKHYQGAVWYQKDVEVPGAWKGRPVLLGLERPHWQTMVWMDERPVGSNDSLSTPHEYDLGTQVSPGTHQITVRVDNRMVVDVGRDSHSVSDHTQGNWNGIVGRIELRATEPVFFEELQVFPRVAARSVTVEGRIGNASGDPGRGVVSLRVEPVGLDAKPPKAVAVDASWDTKGGRFEADYSLGPEARLWDEFEPALYRLTATLENGAERGVTFGLREIATTGTQFVVNGRKTWFRGTTECAIFPRTGHPPMDVDWWRRTIRVAQAHGLNHFRYHSFCPPEAAFAAADELGFYFQVEVASWANASTRLGMGLAVDEWIDREAERIVSAYGNHPSFVLMAYGNEPGGPHQPWLARWVERWKAKDPRRLYTSASGWPELPENEFHVSPGPRIQLWGAGLSSRVNASPPETRTDYREYIGARRVPVISHEIGQWCVYPRFAEMAGYTGYLKPRNFEIFRDFLEANGLLDQAEDFVRASGKLQTLLYKEEIESALRTPGMGGFQLLQLHDFPGQGTALVGVLDPFWEEKGYVSPEEFRRFCDRTVLLARLDKRVFTTAEDLEADVEVSHFGAAPLADAKATWRLADEDGKVVASGQLGARDIPVDNGTALGPVRVPLADLAAPARYRLVVGLAGTDHENDWDLWVYPAEVTADPPAGVTVVEDLGEATLARLQLGGRVLLLVPPGRVRGDESGPVGLGFSSIFWNTAWTSGQKPHTLGILCDPAHPAFAAFPTEYHSNWQWWYLISRAGAMILDGLPGALRPTVQVIDDWFTSRRLGLVLEARVGQGRLLVSSIDLATGLEENVVARQLRRSLLDYMASDLFTPAVELTVADLRTLVEPPTSDEQRSESPE